MPAPRIFITAVEMISPAGWGVHTHLDAFRSEQSPLRNVHGTAEGHLPDFVKNALERLREEKSLKNQDPVTQLAVLLIRSMATKSRIPPDFGVIFGSSRGAARHLEAAIAEHLEGRRLHPLTSPTTTASSLPAAIARELGLEGPSLAISAACSTGLHAIIQAAASIRMDMAPGMIAGGAESANTRFTLDMLKEAKVYAEPKGDAEFPCRPGAMDRNGMVLSEGAAAVLLESDPWQAPLGELVGWGAATEKSTLTGISPDGSVLVKAISQALKIAGLQVSDIDLIVGHGAGTQKGDAAEMKAYETLFFDQVPVVWHKWLLGHMLGASACASVILGLHHLKEGLLPPHPYFPFGDFRRSERRLQSQRHLLVTALGFGGNAAALIVKNPALIEF